MLEKNIRQVKPSVVAIGFRPNPDQVTILGSGFAIDTNGKILSAAHLFDKLNHDGISNLVAMAMIEQDEKKDFERYNWLPLELISKENKYDVALLQIEDHKKTLLKPLQLEDSDKVNIGEEVYFVGFPYAAQLIKDGFGITLIVNKTIVSNIKRDGKDPEHKRNFIILDTISNPGNSGCPLISLKSNKVVGIMSISFRMKSKIQPGLDIREPMHICAAKPINLVKELLKDK